MYRTLSLLLILLLCSVRALAQVSAVPSLMNFQGRLTRPDGTPVVDGNYSVRFSLWTALTGGTEKWNQTVNPLTVRKGTFAALLSGFPAGTFNANVWLEIKIGSNAPLTPRQQLVSVAYAMKADSVKDGAITGSSIANGTITADKLASNAFNSLAWLLGGNGGVTSGFLGTTDTNPLELRANNRRVMRYSSEEVTGLRGVNVLGGVDINEIGTGVWGATIAGGGQVGNLTTLPNRVLGFLGTVGGGRGNTAAVLATVAGGTQNTAGVTATIGGGEHNSASGDVSTIAGGGYNTSSGDRATVGGGTLNTASGTQSVVAGGVENNASNRFVTVGGGSQNTANGEIATIAGGHSNSASGRGATVPGGGNNSASGDYSFAAGHWAIAGHEGAFVWNDRSGDSFGSTAANQFNVRAAGGIRLFTNAAATIGVTLDANDSSWNVVSDRNAKTNISPVDTLDILERLLAIPVATWNYKEVEHPTTHIGPMAQDFFAAFQVGRDDKHIGTIDADGVALAAIQGLNEKMRRQMEEKQKQIEALQAQVKALTHAVEQLQAQQKAYSSTR